MKLAPNVEISAWLDKLLRNLADLGPVEEIKNPDVRAYAAMMQQMLTLVERNMDASQPDEDFQRRMINAALIQWRDIVTARDIVPPLNAKKAFWDAREKHLKKLKQESADRDIKIIAAAREILAVRPTLNNTELAGRLSKRKLGGKESIRKKLPRLMPR